MNTFPFPGAIGPSGRVRIFWVSLILGAATAFFIGQVSAPARESGYTGLSLQFAGTPEKAKTILNAWGETGRDAIALGIRIDFVFILFYVATLIFGCQIAAERFWARGKLRWARCGPLLAWCAIAAGAFDLVENCLQLELLSGLMETDWPAIIRVCASLKFLLTGAAALYTLAGLLVFRPRLSR